MYPPFVVVVVVVCLFVLFLFCDDCFGFCPSKWVSGPRGYNIRLSDLDGTNGKGETDN